jgi:hypothetical protein
MQKYYLSGISLIELLIAITLGLFLLLSTYELLEHESYFLKTTIELSDEKAITLFAQQILTKALHESGYFGCRTLNNQTLSLGKSITIYSGSGDFFEPYTPSQYKIANPHSDILVIQSLDNDASFLKNAMQTINEPISVINISAFKENNIVFIADCETSENFLITSIDTNNHLLYHAPLQKTYGQNSQAGILNAIAFFISNDESGHYALFTQKNNDHAEALIPNVNSFKLVQNNNILEITLHITTPQDKDKIVTFMVGVLND